MSGTVEVSFHGIEKSEAIEQQVRDRVAKLKKHFARMTGCRVAIEVPQRTPERPKVFQVKIEIGVPRRAAVVVSHERTGSHANVELPRAIRDAFDAALRKVDGMSAKIGQRSRIERGRRRPSPGQSTRPEQTE
jgi:ribosome-associated translation inhibitor RaiA